MDISNMKRSKIRYALYRCKNNCADADHWDVFNFYSDELAELGMTAEDFAIENGWDISKKDPAQIVTGKTVNKYIKDLLAPTFSVK